MAYFNFWDFINEVPDSTIIVMIGFVSLMYYVLFFYDDGRGGDNATR